MSGVRRDDGRPVDDTLVGAAAGGVPVFGGVLVSGGASVPGGGATAGRATGAAVSA
ncbi:hypothetical protein [Micromonospora sp. BL4]|uniref:hypothetical protein n=1 Tax=Micromonospora sp. BL4 TaxID=2478710 RepID=UPI0013151ECE|nr:hypothetical protein [Micromonospora sp. BL4]